MSNDLISRTEVLKLIENIKENRNLPKNYGTLLDIMWKIRKIPTAYDVDKVVDQLELHKNCYEAKAAKYDECGDIINMDISDAISLAYEKAIEIIRGQCK